ncbi:MAG: hypothetical protein GF398_18260 [Chitinivibrionales bacterium]|nr:hypothetical protein [Chitinivibrionales bacterium]
MVYMENVYRFYYSIRPIIPRSLQLFLRRQLARYKRSQCSNIWPIDPQSAKPPENWQGWPDGKQFAFALMHDVDTQKGHDDTVKLMREEKKIGFRSSYNFVPERYAVDRKILEEIKGSGFELGVHGLNHDGKLFKNYRKFISRACKINRYMTDWGAKGFSSPSMHHNLAWMHKIQSGYGTTMFDTDPFEPQSDPARTVFPFSVQYNHAKKDRAYIEIPYTLPQDHLLFIILQETSIEIWKQKLDWIAKVGGLALLNTHSDYMRFDSSKHNNEIYDADLYLSFLNNAKVAYADSCWHALPHQIADHFRTLSPGQ